MRYFNVSFFSNDYGSERYGIETYILVSDTYPSRSNLSSFGVITSGRNTLEELCGIAEISKQDAIEFQGGEEGFYDLKESVRLKTTVVVNGVLNQK